MERIKIADPFIDEEVEQLVLQVLRSKRLVSGALVERFENELARYLSVKHVVALSSGTAALHLAFEALNVEGKEVVTSAFTFPASANAILYARAKPVFADIELETYNIDPASVEERVSEECVAIEPVHLYGHSAKMDDILSIAKRKGLFVVEDAAQAIGSTFRQSYVGTLGNVGCFSTYATKNLHTIEGGFVATQDAQIAKKVSMLRNHGQESKYTQLELGYNYRMTEVQAAIGLPQIKRLEELIELRRRNARLLNEGLEGIDGIVTPIEKKWSRHVYHQYTIRVEPQKLGITRDKLAAKLLEKGIETSVHYPLPVYLQPYYVKRFGYKKGMCPNSELASQSVLSLPVHPSLKQEEIERIVNAIKEIVGHH
ncbi:hypothetical protein B9Q13_03950 [Candidatus Marsarchaeota G2 archaeon ECH_B_SAG-G16]|jgi:perosamine synthetase|uniref:Aminotransferase DegT n=1 Tax=Candidatus Marsarchaeota G2 archaeon ECH_B_SAG-G16 TaxID=1978167 RepID=A0A2R6C1G6_9ARCH|nr:MAG: hypothetical protein B9Q13_03950 [Candidatus Marsarchaeota G2 archaeon ECH_B_SAG-G16]